MTLSNLSQYGINFQIKVLSSLLTHKEFLLNIHDVISEDYFDNQAHQWIIKEILKYYQKYHTTPSMDVLKVELKKIDNEILQVSIKEQLREAYKASDEDLKYIEEEFSNFCKNQQLKKALLSSVNFLNAGDYDTIRSLIDNALKAGQDKNVGHEYNKEVESRYREDHRIVVPSPWDSFNIDSLIGSLISTIPSWHLNDHSRNILSITVIMLLGFLQEFLLLLEFLLVFHLLERLRLH